ncbi:MAG: hypothetical protein VW445_10745, partial [Rhodospirillaceae bacterium]
MPANIKTKFQHHWQLSTFFAALFIFLGEHAHATVSLLERSSIADSPRQITPALIPDSTLHSEKFLLANNHDVNTSNAAETFTTDGQQSSEPQGTEISEGTSDGQQSSEPQGTEISEGTSDGQQSSEPQGTEISEGTSDGVSKDNKSKKLITQEFNEVGKAYKEKRFRDAFKGFLRLASEHDFPEAQFNLAVMLKLGQGTLQNFGEAYKWCVLAELNGLEKAKKYEERLKDLLTETRHAALHKEVATLLESKIYKGSGKHIVQLSEWLLREPFDNTKNRERALVWALVGSA